MLSACRHRLRRWPEPTAAEVRESFTEPLSFLYRRFAPCAIDCQVNVTRFSTWTSGREKRARPAKKIQLEPYVHKRFASAPSAAPEPTAKTDAPKFDRRRLRIVERDYDLKDICWGWRPENIDIPPSFDEKGTSGFGRWLENYEEDKQTQSSRSQIEKEVPEKDRGHDSLFPPDASAGGKTTYRDDWLSALKRRIHGQSTKYNETLVQKTLESMMEFFEAPPSTIPASENQKVLHIPYKKLTGLFGNSLGSTASLQLGSGCHAEFTLLDADPAENDRICAVTLHGSEYSIALAETEILSAIDSLEQNPPTPTQSHAEAGLGMTESAAVNKKQLPVFKAAGRQSHHDLLAPPPVWTVNNFAGYIKHLTKLSMSVQNNSLVSPVHKIRPAVICDILYNLCEDPSHHGFLSPEAVQTVLWFLARNNAHKYISQLMPTFEGLVSMGSIDILLHQAARSHNLYLLNDYIQLMRRLNLNPSGREWLYVIAGVEAIPFRLALIAELNRRGLIESNALFQWAVSVSLAPGFRAHMEEGKPFLSYAQSLDDVLGQGWLCERAINTMLFEASLMKRLDTILQILVYCEDKQVKLRSSSLNSALLFFVHTNKMQQGIKFYFDFVATFGAERNSRTLRFLWHLGFRRRGYNVCRVIWAYACLEGRVTQEMREMVRDSLAFRMNPSDKSAKHSPKHIFFQNFGKVAAGALPPPDKITASRMMDRFYEPPSESFSHLYSYVTRGFPREQQLKLAWRIVGDDMNACKHSYEIPPFDEMLRQAAKVDWLWGPPGMVHPKNLRRDAIHMDVRRVTRADGYRVLQRSSKPKYTGSIKPSTTGAFSQS